MNKVSITVKGFRDATISVGGIEVATVKIDAGPGLVNSLLLEEMVGHAVALVREERAYEVYQPEPKEDVTHENGVD